MLNILTIDLEDYFQVHAFSAVIKYDDWSNFECRIERNTDRLLSILGSARSPQQVKPQHRSTSSPKNDSAINTQQSTINNPIRATFFVLGWIAERYPDLVRRIQKEGHEIACHGYAHQLVYRQSRDEFRQDVKRAKSILEDITGSEVIGYRAPSYSITNKSQWAFEILVEEGFKYDSSIFPIRHDFYGLPNAPRFPFIISLNGNNNVEFSILNFELGTAAPQHGTTRAPLEGSTPNSELRTQHSLIEFPLSTVKLFGTNFPISGGGYFRLFPYYLIHRGLKSINQRGNQPFIFYMHPWELDCEQPRIKEVGLKSRFRHYVNLTKAEFKFKRLLSDFQFSTIRQFLTQNSERNTQN
jgi:polysaccharide deacetylase family protein (PEP-CTERM system associated)